MASRVVSPANSIVKALPILIAVRDSRLEIYDKISKESELYDFSAQEDDANKYFNFLDKTGLVNLFKKDGVKNLVDYVTGVEVGLDSNGRKNRGGTLMEEIVELFLADFCRQNGGAARLLSFVH